MRHRPFIPYRSRSTLRARSWQKPLGRYIADFYCSSRRLVIEVDGDSHFSDRGERYDVARTATLAREGLRVIRFTNDEIMGSFEEVCERIREALKS